MYNLLIGNYNNYFNRIVKKEENDFSYYTVMGNIITISNINFNPNDGISTKIVLGKGNYFLPENSDIEPDYAVLYETQLTEPPYIDLTIKSRWFVLECSRTRGGQYELLLRRDVIADNLDDVINAPIYLEKGYINNTNNPLLYNKEAMAVNQIKQYEVALQDETKTGWIVGYIPNNWTGATVEPKVIVPANADYTVAGLSNWNYYKYCTIAPNYKPCWGDNWAREIMVKFKGYNVQNNKNYWTRGMWRWREFGTAGGAEPVWQQNQVVQQTNAPDNWSTYSNLTVNGTGNAAISSTDSQTVFQNIQLNNTFEEYVNNAACELFGCQRGDKDYIMSMNGKTVYDSVSGLFYRIRTIFPTPYQLVGASQLWCTGNTATQRNLVTFINNKMVKTGLSSCTMSGWLDYDDVGIYANQNPVGIVLEQNAIDVECTIDSQRAHLQDAPYDMFCIPYSDELKIYDGKDTFTCNKAVALSMATAIGEQGGSGSVYDVQLLPYCPIREAVQRSATPSDTLDISTISYDIITQKTTGTKLSAVLWSPRSTFTFDINELDDITYCKFEAPFKPLGSTNLVSKKYLILDTLPTTVPSRRAVSTSGSNNIKCYKVSKETGEVIENIGNMNCIQLMPSTNVLQVYVNGSYSNPAIDMAFSSYNNANWYLLFYIDDNSWGGQNIDIFASLCKYPTQIYYDVDLRTPTEAKLTNECNLYRLSSGNQSSIFEFSPAKSFGFSGYKIDCTYKPFQPWIHIIPKLGGLYGDQFVSIDDNRGLVLGGDYSVTQLTNTWATYKLQNSTYQDMFNREIQHMDVENSIQEQEQWFKSMTGIVGGGVAGGMAGGMAGGPWGAVAGAIVGTAASGIGAGFDINNMYKMQNENKDFKTDMYNYNLQNMKAIPSGMAKTSAFVYNTRIWPFLEVYTCTDVEKEAFRNKLQYDGMTIMAICKLIDYLDSEEKHLWRGELIRMPNINHDSHVVEEIYSELKKGVYL